MQSSLEEMMKSVNFTKVISHNYFVGRALQEIKEYDEACKIFD